MSWNKPELLQWAIEKKLELPKGPKTTLPVLKKIIAGHIDKSDVRYRAEKIMDKYNIKCHRLPL